MAEKEIPADDEGDTLMKEEDAGETLPSRREKMCNIFMKIYLPLSYAIVVAFGALVPQPGVFFNHPATQYICVVWIFINSGLYLRTSAMKEVIYSYKGTIYGVLAILGFTPIIGGQLTLLLPFTEYVSSISSNASFNGSDKFNYVESAIGPFEYKVALTLFFVLPCTISTGIVMVSQLNGHVALAIFLTVVCNVLGIFTTPLYIKWMIASGVDVEFDVAKLMMRLSLTVLLPLLIGKLLRCVTKIRQFITPPKRKLIVKIINITLIDIIVWVKASQTSADGGLDKIKAVNALFVVAWGMAMHSIFILLNAIAAWILRLPYDMKKTLIILASQKTLVLGIPVTTFLPVALGDQGTMVIAMVICQTTIILFDAIIIPCWVVIDAKKKKKMDSDDARNRVI